MSESPPAPTLPPAGLFLCLEGVDGSGKSTQIRRLADHLRGLGWRVRVEKEPTDGPHGRRVRESARTGRLDPREELREILADRRQHVEEVIRPALAAGEVVILDRYFWSSMAYQGATLGDPESILAANLAFAPVPDLTLFLDVPVATSQARINSRDGSPNHFERSEFLAACRNIFLSIRHPRFVRLDGDRPAEAVEADILRQVKEILPGGVGPTGGHPAPATGAHRPAPPGD
jgi:dTMP kinase